jgi:hypothetical protein
VPTKTILLMSGLQASEVRGSFVGGKITMKQKVKVKAYPFTLGSKKSRSKSVDSGVPSIGAALWMT